MFTRNLTTPGHACKLAAASTLTADCNPFFHVTNSKSDSAPPAPAPDFEASLAELESIVEKLEQGELSLDDSLKQFERGVQLTRICQTALTQAEQKVEILLRKSGNVAGDDAFEPAPFDADDSES